MSNKANAAAPKGNGLSTLDLNYYTYFHTRITTRIALNFLLSRRRERFCHIWRLTPPIRVLKPPQSRHTVLKQKSFLCLSFNPFYSLKCVQGAGENELVPAPCLAFLSITEDPQRRSEKLKQTEVRLLAVLCKIIVSPLDPLYFLLLSLILLVFSCLAHARLCLAFLSFILFTVPYSMPIFFFFSHLLSHFLPSSLILTSTLLLLFWFI